MEELDQLVFYSLEKTIKTYRQFAQKNITKKNVDITIDQWLILMSLQHNPDITQQQIAVSVFKDYASITRIIELLVKKKLLTRASHSGDRRRFSLCITRKGIDVLKTLTPIIIANRRQALNGITKKDIMTMKAILNKITKNCI